MLDPKALEYVELAADEAWRLLESKGVVDAINGAEYERRIVGLRAWLWDEGPAPEDES